MEQCGECRFEFVLASAEGAGPAIVQGGARLAQMLTQPRSDVLSRRSEGVWSPLEYACHLRDVLLVQRERVLLARRAERPSPPLMGREERVEHDGYADQQPEDVARQLEDAALLFANVLARLGPEDWERSVLYDGLEPADRSLRWVAVDTWHEVHHHLLDVERQVT